MARPDPADAPLLRHELATFGDTPPFVREVAWEHPLVRGAMRAIAPAWPTLHLHPEWRAPYALEPESAAHDRARRDARVRNFIRVLVGELRDNEPLLRRKLAVLAATHVAMSRDGDVRAEHVRDAFALGVPAVLRLSEAMETLQVARQIARLHPRDGFHLGFADERRASCRVERSVPPWTEDELAFAASRLLQPGSPRLVLPEDAASVPDALSTSAYDAELAVFLAGLGPDRRRARARMLTFRGHRVLVPLWLESNAFVWASRRAARALARCGDVSYYLHPFRERRRQGLGLLGTFLFFPRRDRDAFYRASEPGGGPILYVTDGDVRGKGIPDYYLFRRCAGAGEGTSNEPDPNLNANLVPHEVLLRARLTTAAVRGYRRELLEQPDLGFFDVFPRFEDRAGRLHQALDRHTNWGPTSYLLLGASPPGTRVSEVDVLGGYSPFVATSFDLSDSMSFAIDETEVDERRRAPQWLHLVRFPRTSYYDERDLRRGRELDFGRAWLNETSLSNNAYGERGLDRFGWVPEDELAENVYLGFGARGEQPPELEDVPPPRE